MEKPEIVYGLYPIDDEQYWSFSVNRLDIEKLKIDNPTWIGPIEFTYRQAFTQYSIDQAGWEDKNPEEEDFLKELASWTKK